MKFPRCTAVFLTFVISSPAFANCPGPGCPAGPSSAGDFIAGAIIGGIIGANPNKKNRTTKSATRGTPVEDSSLESVIETQKALNFLGFSAGTEDGIAGRQTRNAIRSYQSIRGFRVTGRLGENQRIALAEDFRNALRIRSSVESSSGASE
jgi:peptidoglycan hydrolase-like protein with peptidoglycan-binding domain